MIQRVHQPGYVKSILDGKSSWVCIVFLMFLPRQRNAGQVRGFLSIAMGARVAGIA
jgi:hypothetical protein